MKIAQVLTFSLVDYPGEACAVIFTAGCNLHCPWCHNWPIAWGPEKDRDIGDRAWVLLRKAKKHLDAVCVTGGEPTIHLDLPDLFRKLKGMGFKTKLDTNGTNPWMVEKLLGEKLVDYIALDVKASPKNYPKITGSKANVWRQVKQTIDILRRSGVGYELRLIYIPGMTTKDDLKFFESLVRGEEKAFLTLVRETETFRPGRVAQLPEVKGATWRR